jgi:hypothetical protein
MQDRTITLPSTTCYDSATMLSLVIPLGAPGGSTVLSPLSTLLALAPYGLDAGAMEQAIMAGFKLPSNFKIGHTDAYYELNVNNVR